MAKEVVVAMYYYLNLAQMISLAKVAWGEGNYHIYCEYSPCLGDEEGFGHLKLFDESELNSAQLFDNDRFFVCKYLLENGAEVINFSAEKSDIFSFLPDDRVVGEFEIDDLSRGIITPFTGKNGGNPAYSHEIARHDPRLIAAIRATEEKYNQAQNFRIEIIPGNKYAIIEPEEGYDVLEYPETDRLWITIPD